MAPKIEALLFRTCLFLAERSSQWRLYYLCERHLYHLRSVAVLPMWVYRAMFRLGIRLVEYKQCRCVADRIIHAIPYHVRLDVS